jgi:hypothetical protein
MHDLALASCSRGRVVDGFVTFEATSSPIGSAEPVPSTAIAGGRYAVWRPRWPPQAWQLRPAEQWQRGRGRGRGRGRVLVGPGPWGQLAHHCAWACVCVVVRVGEQNKHPPFRTTASAYTLSQFARPYPAATISACTASSAAWVVNPAVITPSKNVPMAPSELSPPIPARSQRRQQHGTHTT